MNDVAEATVAETSGQNMPVPPAPLLPSPVSFPAASRYARCPRCHADLTRCGPAARYCPRCGSSRPSAETPKTTDTPATPAAPAPERSRAPQVTPPTEAGPFATGVPIAAASAAQPASPGEVADTTSAGALPAEAAPPAAGPLPPLPVLAITEHASAWMRLHTAQRSAQPPAAPCVSAYRHDDSHSLMLLGYANAMFRLGYRYETALGHRHNPNEAIRCYFKAAKLGNADALARLAPQCAAPPTLPGTPIQPPQG